MPETNTAVLDVSQRVRKIQYRGRGGQVIIYIGKLLRGFIYQSDWKVLPMAALIAGVVSMVVRNDFFLTMEGTLKGALALTCTAIWNGCFNSIQVICRERDIIKREHRSGLHITAYIFSHMVYQAILCLLQTGLTLYVCKLAGIQFPEKGLITPLLIVDLGITIFLITFASDMLSLWISCIARNTTTAMTVMPFVLIFQLVFSGGMFSLPAWAERFSIFSISNYGMKCVTAQADFNHLPMVSGWNSLERIENQEINTTVTLGEVFDFLSDDSRAMVHDLRDNEISIPTAEDVLTVIEKMQNASANVENAFPISELLQMARSMVTEAGPAIQDAVPQTIKVGDLIDILAASDYVVNNRDLSYNFQTTIGTVIDTVGRDKQKIYIEEETAAASRLNYYENTKDNIFDYWIHICYFIVGFSLLSVIFLEFIDKDKR